ncbi:MAG: glycosyltransferase family 2 protein [Candidatus Doudnabacteria bacterium]|nr:glycosyltransferase family 2 protein [Candidatus Doudnabacteria bacterium]
MPKLFINLLGWNHRSKLHAAINSVLAQGFRDFDFVYTDNASTDGSTDFVKKTFPQVQVKQNKQNLGYAAGHNLAFQQTDAELVMVLNPDVILDTDFLKHIVRAFDDHRVAVAGGKMLRPGPGRVLDGTGVVINRARRARERGQREHDQGQYDRDRAVFGVSGTAAVFRKSALEQTKVPKADGGFEYFDEDFFAYWEDVDLSWRLRLWGFTCRYVPQAVLYHERLAGSSPGGYKKIAAFISHHKQLPDNVKKWNWKNHLFCIIKNDFGWPFWRDLPLILARELAMLVFILIFEPKTLGVLPRFFRELPVMLAKRRYIMAHKKVGANVVLPWFKNS